MATTTRSKVADPSRPVEYRDAVRGFLASLVRDRALADDLTQETFLRAKRTGAAYGGRASMRTWLFAIALNLARDHFRAAARRGTAVDLRAAEDVPSAEPGPEFAAMETEMAACIGHYVLQLPERQRDVVALHDLGGLATAQIALHLDVSEGHARVLLHRGRAALRRILEANCTLSFDDNIPCEPRSRDR